MAYCSTAPCAASVAPSVNAPLKKPPLRVCDARPKPIKPPPKPATALVETSVKIAEGFNAAERPTLWATRSFAKSNRLLWSNPLPSSLFFKL